MRYFYDSEFIEDGRTIDLISLGVVAEDGREFYAVSNEWDAGKANEWVRQNVLAHLPPEGSGFIGKVVYSDDAAEYTAWDHDTVRPFQWPIGFVVSAEWHYITRKKIRAELQRFVEGDAKPEFWGYYADYDHVVLSQLFGAMIELPDGWPLYTRDIKQLCDSLGNPKLPEQGKGEHHALADARWNKAAYEFLMRGNSGLPLNLPQTTDCLHALKAAVLQEPKAVQDRIFKRYNTYPFRQGTLDALTKVRKE